MKKTHRLSFTIRYSALFSLCLAVILLLCMSTGIAVTEDKKESLYNNALMSLESWLEAPGEQGTDQLDSLISVFDELGRYEQSRNFCKYYVPLLKNTMEEEFGYNFSFQIERLEAEERFQEYLEELNSSSILTSKELIAYARGRKAQAEGAEDLAMEYYKQSGGYYDAGDRIDAIFATRYQSAYDSGIVAFESGDLVNAYLYFEKAGGYEDSNERMEYISGVIGHIPHVGEIWPIPEPTLTPTPEPTPEPTPAEVEKPSVPVFSEVYPGADAHLRKKNDENSRVYSRTGPGNEFVPCGGYKPYKQKKITVYFEENGFVLADVQYQSAEERFVYLPRYSFDSIGYITAISALEYYSGTTTADITPSWGPDNRFNAVQSLVVNKGTSVRVFFQEKGFVYAEYICDKGTVRMWLPAGDIDMADATISTSNVPIVPAGQSQFK